MVVVAGEALIDRIESPDGRIAHVQGGGPYNTARTIGRLGGDVRFLGRLSTDAFGQLLADGLEADGVDMTAVVRTDDPTTLAIAKLDDTGTATYRFHTDGTSAPGLSPGDVEGALADRPAPRAFHLGTLGLVLEPMATTLAAAVARLGDDTLLMVDPNCRPSVIPDREAYVARLSQVLARADVVKVSVDDLAYLAPGSTPLAAAQALVQAGARLVLVTDGARAVNVVSGPFEAALSVPRVPVVDTVGSGDAFGGAFLAWWVERGFGRDDLADGTAVAEAAGAAIAVASLTCQRPGADPPTRAEAGWVAR